MAADYLFIHSRSLTYGTTSIFCLHSENIVALDIYFQDLSYDEIEQTPQFEIWTLICESCTLFLHFMTYNMVLVFWYTKQQTTEKP